MQQASMLRSPENRQIIKKAVDDASTLRASVTKSQIGPLTIVSHPESIIGSLELDIDNDLINTRPYRSALAYHQSKGSVKKLNRSASDSKNPFRRGIAQGETTKTTASTEDDDYYDADADIINPKAYHKTMAGTKPREAGESLTRSMSDSASRTSRRRNRELLKVAENLEETDQLTPMERFENDTWEKPRPYRRATSPDAFDRMSNHDRQLPVRHVVSASDPAILRQFSFNTGHQKTPPEVKKSFWGTIKGKAGRSNVNLLRTQAPSSPSTDTLSPMPGARRVKRKHEINIHTSIDFGSPESLSAPAVVRAAQSSSYKQILKLLEQRVNIEGRHSQSGRTALAVAAHCGNEEIVALLLQQGAQTNVLDSSNMMPLHLAASRGHYDVVRLLLDDHVNIDAVGPNGKTALRLAADNGYHVAVELLLQERAKVNARGHDHSTALHAAARVGDDVIVKLLIAHGADCEAKDGELMAPIHYAAENDHDHVIEILLNHRADIEAQGKRGMSPLSMACLAGSKQVAKMLVSRKANCKHKSFGGMTPLHWAANGGHEEIGDLLIQQKRVNIDAKNEEGKTPLHIAVLKRSFAVTDFLIRRGAAIEAECLESQRPLHYACKNADPALVQLLLASGADVEASAKSWRPIHYATRAASIPVLSLLIDASATLEARDSLGDRALTIAASLGHLDIVKYLFDNGAAVSLPMPTKSNRPHAYDSPICKAAKAGHLTVVQELVKQGASIHSPDASNCQPLRYAAYHGHASTVRYLLSQGASLAILGLDPGSVEAGVGVMASTGLTGFHPSVPGERREEVLAIVREETEARERERKKEVSLERMQERVQEQMMANMAGQRVGVDETFYMPRASELSAVNYSRD